LLAAAVQAHKQAALRVLVGLAAAVLHSLIQVEHLAPLIQAAAVLPAMMAVALDQVLAVVQA
jgi:hypothetical protein